MNFYPLFCLLIESSLHDSVKDTPFFLLYGRDAKLPLDQVLDNPYRVLAGAETYRERLIMYLHKAHQLARVSLEKAQTRQKQFYDKKKPPSRSYSVGDSVYLYVPRVKRGQTPKFAHYWQGPYVIAKKMSPVNYQIVSDKGVKQVVHVNRLKPANIRFSQISESDSDEYNDEWSSSDELPLAHLL